MIWGLRSARTIVIAAAAVAFVVFCVLPVLYMVVRALSALPGAAVLDARQRSLLSTTIVVGAGTAALATIVGAPLGFVLARVHLPFKNTLRLALVAPALLPPYIVALAWIYVATNLIPEPYSIAGVIAVLTAVFYPLSMVATEAGLRRIEPRLEEAALLAARPARVVLRITGPLVARQVLAAALVIFVLAISEFSVPGLLRVRVYTTEVFTAFAARYDFAGATAVALPLVVVSFGVASAAALLMRERVVATRRGSAGSPPVAFSAWRRPALAVIVCVMVVMLVVPLAALINEAFRSTSIVAAIRGSRDAVVNSLLLAALGATAVTVVALYLGYARARASDSTGSVLDIVWVAMFTVPSTVVGIGLIGLWNRSGPGGSIYGTSAMLVCGYLARFVPVAALMLAATIRSVPISHEEAAATAGAGWLSTMHRIVVPQIRAGLAAAWAISFMLAFGEVGTSILVAPPGESTLPIRVYTLIANAPPGQMAALALFQASVILFPLIALASIVAARAKS